MLAGIAMISIEQWRAQIGTFNCKRGYSGFLSSSSYYYYQPRKRKNLSRDHFSTAVTSLQAEGHSPSAPSDGYTVSSNSITCTSGITTNCKATTSAVPCITTVTTSFSSPSSYFLYSSSGGLFQSLRRSLLRDVIIILLIAILSQQLIISGDIETNPGPKHGGKYTLE